MKCSICNKDLRPIDLKIKIGTVLTENNRLVCYLCCPDLEEEQIPDPDDENRFKKKKNNNNRF